MSGDRSRCTKSPTLGHFNLAGVPAPEHRAMGVDLVELDTDRCVALFQEKRIVHVKGFGSGLDFKDAETMAAAASLLDWLRRSAVDVVVWDGDDFSTSSFSNVVARAGFELSKSILMQPLCRVEYSRRGCVGRIQVCERACSIHNQLADSSSHVCCRR